MTNNTSTTEVLTLSQNDGCTSCETDLSKAELPIVLVASIVMNGTAVLILAKLKRRNKGVDITMVLTLAVNDLITSALFAAMWIGGWIKCGCMMSYQVCAVLGWLASAMVIWSAWVIAIMSACRFLATVKPLYFRTNVTFSSIHVALVVTLVSTLGSLTFPFFDVAAEYEYYDENMICAYDFTPGHGEQAHRIILGVLTSTGLLTTMLVLYFNFSIVYKLRRRNTIHSEMSSMSTNDSGQNKRTAFANVTKVVSVVYCVCYGPFLVRLLYDVIINAPDQDQLYHSITMTLLFMSPLLNPMVYVACNRRYREFIINHAKSFWSRLNIKRSRGSELTLDMSTLSAQVVSSRQ